MRTLEIPADILRAIAEGAIDGFMVDEVWLKTAPQDWSAYWPEMNTMLGVCFECNEKHIPIDKATLLCAECGGTAPAPLGEHTHPNPETPTEVYTCGWTGCTLTHDREDDRMAEKVQVHKGQDGQWYWRRVAGNGEIIAYGEGYTRRDSALESAIENFPDDIIEVIEGVTEELL